MKIDKEKKILVLRQRVMIEIYVQLYWTDRPRCHPTEHFAFIVWEFRFAMAQGASAIKTTKNVSLFTRLGGFFFGRIP